MQGTPRGRKQFRPRSFTVAEPYCQPDTIKDSMMKFPLPLTALATVAALAACGPYVKTTVATADATTTVEKVGSKTRATTVVTPVPGTGARSTVKWAGTYAGTLPCADCPGIATAITLGLQGTYQMTETYIGKSSPITTQGRYGWDPSGDYIKLDPAGNGAWFKVLDGQLQRLDMNGKPVKGATAPAYFLGKA